MAQVEISGTAETETLTSAGPKEQVGMPPGPQSVLMNLSVSVVPSAVKVKEYGSHPMLSLVAPAELNVNVWKSPFTSTPMDLTAGSPSGLPASQKLTRYFWPFVTLKSCLTEPVA